MTLSINHLVLVSLLNTGTDTLNLSFLCLLIYLMHRALITCTHVVDLKHEGMLLLIEQKVVASLCIVHALKQSGILHALLSTIYI